MSKANCIDISCFQGSVDFAKAKAAGIKYVILRTIRKGLVVDQSFETYYKAARAAGLKVGVYLYTYATTTSYVQKEAAALIELLAGRKLDLPVWLDMETSTLRKSSASTVQGIASAFRKKIAAAGYQCGIYCDADFYRAKSHFSGFDSGCEFWIASYGVNDGVQHTVPCINHHLFGHQFSSRGKISGISGYVDVSCVYGVATGTSAAPTIITTTTETEEHKMDTLRRGDKGQQVYCLQLALNHAIGANLACDSIFGPKTEIAIQTAQKKYGLTVDLIVGPKTWGKLLA